MKNYEFLEHTADLGIRVWGVDLKDLFINAASAMYDLVADITKVKPSRSVKVKLQAQDRDQLLRNWLSELLYYFHTKGMLLSEFQVEKVNGRRIISTAKGEEIDTTEHELRHDIKAVTFHNLKIEEREGRLSTEIIFDV